MTLNSPTLKNILIQLFLTIAVPTMLAIGSIRLVMSYQFLQFEYTRADFPPDFYGFTTEDRLEYGPYSIDYLLNDEGIEFLDGLRLPLEKCWRPLANATDCAMFEEEALRHMVDVKQVTIATYSIALLVTLIMVGILIVAYRNPSYRRSVRLGLTYGSMLTLGIIVSIIVLAVSAWNVFFDTFHEIFFEAGTWRFAFSDTLIRLYPEKFWFDASITIGALSGIGAMMILAAMWYGRRYLS